MPKDYSCNFDPYVYEGTNILKNKLNIKESSTLENLERELTKEKSEVIVFKTSSDIDFQHLKDVHYSLFHDIYCWAGEVRTVPLGIDGFDFCISRNIETMTDKLFEKLSVNNFLVGLTFSEYVRSFSYYYSELNAIHPFRDGNGRAQRVVFDHLAEKSRYRVNWAVLINQRDRWIYACKLGAIHLDYSELESIFSEIIFV